jgi:hypothetical protein
MKRTRGGIISSMKKEIQKKIKRTEMEGKGEEVKECRRRKE